MIEKGNDSLLEIADYVAWIFCRKYYSDIIKKQEFEAKKKANAQAKAKKKADFDKKVAAQKKANEEAKLYMNPRTSKSAWLSPENMTKSVYDLKLDAIATVYTVTKF